MKREKFLWFGSMLCVAGLAIAANLWTAPGEAQTGPTTEPMTCKDAPDLSWRCFVFPSEDFSVTMILLEDNCLSPKEGQAAVWKSDPVTGQAIFHVVAVPRVEGCVPGE